MYATASLLTISGGAPEQWGSAGMARYPTSEVGIRGCEEFHATVTAEFPRDKNARVS